MATSVSNIVSRARETLNDPDGIRWTDSFLIECLNECYSVLTRVKPSECTVGEELTLVAGSKQSIPNDAERLVEISHNTISSKEAVVLISRDDLDELLPGWHSEDESDDIEHYMFNEMAPAEYFVSPPASANARLYGYLVKVPASHDTDIVTSGSEEISVAESVAPLLVDYILFRCFSLDADNASNANRAALHLNAFNMQADTGFKLEIATSPNAGSK